MSFSYGIERDEDRAIVFAKGTITVAAASEIFQQIDHLIDGGYHLSIDISETDFMSLGMVRYLQIASLRARKANLDLQLVSGPALLRVADLVGEERWSPLPRISPEDDSVAV